MKSKNIIRMKIKTFGKGSFLLGILNLALLVLFTSCATDDTQTVARFK